MKAFSRLTSAAAALLLIAGSSLFFSCATTGAAKSAKHTATLTKQAERFFWRIDGTDKTGNPSVVYIQGTMHVGNDSLYPIADGVMDAWNSSNRFVAELTVDDIRNLQMEGQEMVMASREKAAGRNLFDGLTETQAEFLRSILPEEETVQISEFEPWVLSQLLALGLYSGTGFTADKAIDLYFMMLSYQQGHTLEALDTLDDQKELLVYGTYDQQLIRLQNTIDTILDTDKINRYIVDLTKSYVDGDVDTFTTIMQESYEDDIKYADFYKDYYKTMLDVRNEKWAKTIADYLAEGGTTFVFAGSAHFIGDNSVFSYMRKQGSLK